MLRARRGSPTFLTHTHTHTHSLSLSLPLSLSSLPCSTTPLFPLSSCTPSPSPFLSSPLMRPPQTHSCFQKACMILGLKPRVIATEGPTHALAPAALQRAIEV